MDFGSRMRQLRLEKNMLQKELAIILQISIGTVSNYEKNVHFPDGESLCRIADFFNVSVDYLLGQTDCRNGLDTLNTEITPGNTIGNLVDKIILLDSQKRGDLWRFAEYLESMQKKSSGT